MSKATFSAKICDAMDKKVNATEYFDLKTILENDEDFEIAICLTYMTLSKEKIIEKDIKNNDRLGRLTQMVDTKEIDKVFQPGFAPQMPKIFSARENNNLWILDNIRDSIMHGAFDIDENRKVFIINNNQFNRELSAEVPFSWFIAYAKNDILSKKTADIYTIKNYYYNKGKTNLKNLETSKELYNNILYKVNIYGNKFNVRNIENRINELFKIYANNEVTDEMVELYRKQIDNEKIKYNEKYLVSFYVAREKVIETITKEFPGVSLNITIDNRKQRFVNKSVKKMPTYFTDYDTMLNFFNRAVSPKGTSLLEVISRMVESINVTQNENDFKQTKGFDLKKCTIYLHTLLTGEKVSLDTINNYSQILNSDLEILRAIYLNIYGLSTLVINHETLYNQHFINRHPSEFGLHACLKRPYLDYASKRRTLIMKGLDIEINLFNKNQQLNNCKSDAAKIKIQENINDLTLKLNEVKNELDELKKTLGYEEIIKTQDVNYATKYKLEETIYQYFNHFNAATNVESKRKIKKLIGKLLDIQTLEESKYTYGFCNDMQSLLTIIRNSFSHIGRVYMGKNNGIDTNVILNDYDTNGEKSGDVVCKYEDLIDFLKNPYESIKTK